MANVDMDSGKGGKKSKPRRMNLRVDFTPMVDMNMLLITFFMFCTTLSTPQIMDIVVPTKDKPDDPTLLSDKKVITLILDEQNKIYYYAGMPNYEDYTSLKVTDFSDSGLRNILLDRNGDLSEKSRELRKQLREKKITKEVYKEEMSELRKSRESITVVIKPTEKSSYKNLVDALDEMQVCNIGKYAIVDMEEADDFLMENYKNKGSLTAQL